MSDFYIILGVSHTATTSEITTAYRNLAKIYHPDKATGNTEKFKEISQAYNILVDPVKRQSYDLYGEVRNRGRDHDIQERTFKVPSNNDFFNNIFTQFFGGNEPPKSPSSIETVTPIIETVIVDISETYTGCNKKVSYKRNLICSICYGRGLKPLSNTICHTCEGKKVISQINTVDLQICQGMNEKFKIQFENLGNEEPDKITGDLIIQLSIQNNTPFEIDWPNLKIKQNITLVEAINGVSREIIFVDGNKIRLVTQQDQIVVTDRPVIYRGSGLPIYSEQEQEQVTYGDLYVQYNIVLPTKMSHRLRRLLGGTTFPP